eukprot:TRINITY_DN66400_c6_g1_i2.p1 TRINITY_DN66400_c6_g1~~TRINITY_DN66400_c6_g1_i2.p1  ORF type:complete len:196 (-),score=46.88 TRINITY_DN66400_c6_g1_i2:146-685(-)
MKITFKTIQGRQVRIDIDDGKTIKEAKVQVANHEQILYKLEGLKLVYKGKVLGDNETVTEAGIKENEFVVIVGQPAPKGAPPAELPKEEKKEEPKKEEPKKEEEKKEEPKKEEEKKEDDKKEDKPAGNVTGHVFPNFPPRPAQRSQPSAAFHCLTHQHTPAQPSTAQPSRAQQGLSDHH